MRNLLQRRWLVSAALGIVMACFLGGAAMADQGSAQNTQATDAARVAKGAAYWATQCQRCHNLRSPNEFTDDIWDVSVNHMRIRANIPADQIRAIKAFLKSSN